LETEHGADILTSKNCFETAAEALEREADIKKEKAIGKGKVHPKTGHEGPEGKSMYSSTLSLTSALDGGGWSTQRPGRFTPGNDPVPIVQEAG
jgi:hypothetical protein